MLPAARFFNRAAPPHSRRAVEIEEDIAAGASGVFQHEMSVQQDGLNFGQKGIVAVDMGPAGLHHADFRIGQMVDGAHQESLPAARNRHQRWQ